MRTSRGDGGPSGQGITRGLAAVAVVLMVMVVTAYPAKASPPGSPVSEAPEGLTGIRTPQGVHLSWKGPRTGYLGIWRGTESGKLNLLAQIPAGQSGFLDMGTMKDTVYFYAIGDRENHGAELKIGAVAPVKVLPGLVTTCSGLSKGRAFPANTQNHFVPGRDLHVQYYGYFLLHPFDSTPRKARIVWRDPEGEIFSANETMEVPREVELPTGVFGQILLAQPIGLQHALPQNGQKRVPQAAGIHTVEAFLDDVPVATTVFYLGKQDQAPPAGGHR